jgi:hypothetical protein
LLRNVFLSKSSFWNLGFGFIIMAISACVSFALENVILEKEWVALSEQTMLKIDNRGWVLEKEFFHNEKIISFYSKSSSDTTNTTFSSSDEDYKIIESNDKPVYQVLVFRDKNILLNVLLSFKGLETQHSITVPLNGIER